MICALQCPPCGARLNLAEPDRLVCSHAHSFALIDGIWRMIPAERLANYEPFLQDYEAIRMAEGRGSSGAAHYRSLPYPAADHPQAEAWAIRAQSYEALLAHLIPEQPIAVLDVGAGSGWLSYQLAKRGHTTAAVDLSVNPRDGLGALQHYDLPIESYQAAFEVLPFIDNGVDMVIFNASFHYAADALAVFEEAQRVSRRHVIIVDTPIYHQAGAGESMVAERHAAFERRYGFRSDSRPMINYLTWSQVATLGDLSGIRPRIVWPIGRIRRTARRVKAFIKPGRAPAEFPILCFG